MQDMKRQKAFTLVELIIVISIAGLLLSVLIPVLGKARKAARRIKCAENLKQINFALRQYAIDNNDNIVIAREILFAHSVAEVKRSWHIVLAPYVMQTIEDILADSYPQIWFCPEDNDPYPKGFHYCPHKGMTSYALNGFNEKVNDNLIKLGPAGGFKFSLIRNQSDCMLMGETSYASQFYDIDSEKTENLGIRKDGHHRMTSGFYHDGRMNILFVDGHIVAVRGKKCPPDDNYYPSNYGNKNYAFWSELTLPGADDNPLFWGPGY